MQQPTARQWRMGDVLGRIVHDAGAKYIMDLQTAGAGVGTMKTPAGSARRIDRVVVICQPFKTLYRHLVPYPGIHAATAAMARKSGSLLENKG